MGMPLVGDEPLAAARPAAPQASAPSARVIVTFARGRSSSGGGAGPSREVSGGHAGDEPSAPGDALGDTAWSSSPRLQRKRAAGAAALMQPKETAGSSPAPDGPASPGKRHALARPADSPAAAAPAAASPAGCRRQRGGPAAGKAHSARSPAGSSGRAEAHRAAGGVAAASGGHGLVPPSSPDGSEDSSDEDNNQARLPAGLRGACHLRAPRLPTAFGVLWRALAASSACCAC